MKTLLKSIFALFCVSIQSANAQFLLNIPNIPKLAPSTGNQIYVSSASYSYNEPDANSSHIGVTTGIGYERTQKTIWTSFCEG